MKKYFWIVFAAWALAACGKNEKTDPDPVVKDAVSVTPTSLNFSADGTQTESVTVTASGAWTSSKSASWISLEPSSGSGNAKVTVSAAYNAGEARTGTVTFKMGTASQTLSVAQAKKEAQVKIAIVPAPAAFDGTKRASTTYQLLIYSFADSDGDGVGDFKGIQNKLDYLDGLGVTALWLSPAHPTGSYHGYEVNDYVALNPLYGTEEDFKSLIDAAHAKGISIYMDFVLNHSGTAHEWFKSVKADPANSPYRDYYVLSTNPSADEAAGKIDSYAGAGGPGMGAWHSLGDGEIGYKGRLHFKLSMSGGKPSQVTVNPTTEAPTGSVSNPKVWIYTGSNLPMKEVDGGYELVADIDTSWGFLVRTSTTSWDGGTKWGAKAGASVISFGEPFTLDSSEAKDIVFGSTTYYFASFDASMPDLNYGKYTECENSPVFKATVDAATKWVNMGVDGFRLDAVLWIYQAQLAANQRFLDQWYQAVNKAYREAGHADNIFVVGEAWEDHSTEKQYYKGLISNFEFNYGGMVSGMLGNQNASGYVTAVNNYVTDHTAQRADAVTSFFLTNHDQDRFAEWVGKSAAKEKQAAALLLSGPGKPFVYQGEELGYYGTKSGGDEYVRAPILWNKAGTDCAKKGVNNKVDTGMLKADISVEAQDADAGSLLNVYKTWSRLRNTYPALAEGTLTKAGLSGTSIAAWYMTSGSQKLLVIHNVASSAKEVKVTDSMAKPVGLLGKASVKEQTLTLGANSSVVFEL